MLEDIALRYVNQSEYELRAIHYGLVILGAIIAGVVNKSKDELARAPYFAYSALIVFFVSAVEIVWLQWLPAMIDGYLWVLIVVSIAASIIGGFFFCKIAIARSLDAYGHGRMAALGLIPFANLWLLSRPSKNAVSANRAPTIPLLTGGLGVLSGFAMLIAAVAVTTYIEQEANRMGWLASDRWPVDDLEITGWHPHVLYLVLDPGWVGCAIRSQDVATGTGGKVRLVLLDRG